MSKAKYTIAHAEIDAVLLLEGPMCRVNFTSQTRDKVANTLLRLVARETARGEITRPKLLKTRNGKKQII